MKLLDETWPEREDQESWFQWPEDKPQHIREQLRKSFTNQDLVDQIKELIFFSYVTKGEALQLSRTSFWEKIHNHSMG